MRHFLALAFAALALPSVALAEIDRPGWASFDTTLDYPGLIAAVKSATTENGMGIVTEAGPTEAAKGRGVTIPGNRVIGVFNNVYAVRILELSEAAMIEAPIRMYVTENPDGTATLSYKLPSHVFSPYVDDAGADLEVAAAELDEKFAAIAAAAIKE